MPRKKATDVEIAENVVTTPEENNTEVKENEVLSDAENEIVSDVPETTESERTENVQENTELSADEAVDEVTEPEENTEAEEFTEPESEPELSVPEPEEKKRLNLGILKLNLDEEAKPEINQKDIVWGELVNATRSKKLIPVIVTGLEATQLAGNVVVAHYKGQRIIIPMSEMMINLTDDKKYNDGNIDDRLSRICNTMLGAEIDVVIKGVDKKTESVVASRKDAMNRKRQKFYLTPLSDGLPQIREGRVVEGRIIAVTPMVARIELFGVEVSMSASQLSWDWVSDVSDKFFVGDRINVLIEKLEGDNIDNLKITPNVKSLITNTSLKNLEKCAVQGKYIGEVTNIHNGTAYLRLQIGVNAIAHTNYDKRTPGKGDVVSFVITRINHDYGNVSGVITRIIKQSI